MSHLTRVGNPNVFASLPFDQIDGIAGGYLHDDFIQLLAVADVTQTGAAVFSDLTWFSGEIGGNDAGAACLVGTAAVDHPGVLRMESGTTTPAAGDGIDLQLGQSIESVQETLVLDDNGVYLAAIIKQPNVLIGDWSLGLEGQAPEPFNAGALDVVAIGSEPTDFTGDVVVAQVNGANTDVETLSSVSPVNEDWILAEIGVTSTSMVGRVTTEDVTETIEVIGATYPTVALRPCISTSVSTGTAEVFLDVDAFHMRYLRRDSLVGQGADWLGQ
ncbi:hypothetical protein LCGC14_1759800 [marine sediment metagenome]|uniref:Uncharacterized protein n=1 Tax=marine sediment metagenome TaxID=412755 RepID=A0A0F9JGH9_9ZZZZ